MPNFSQEKMGLVEIESQLPTGILLLHSEKRAEEAAKFQQEVSQLGIFVVAQSEVAGISPEEFTTLVDKAKVILFLPDEELDKSKAEVLEHIMQSRSGFAQVYLQPEDKIKRKMPLLLDRELDWTRPSEKNRLLMTFGKQQKTPKFL